ncbi:MAG TPA: type II CAAX endopeptidase family protein [Gaiellaceae bacterium]|nr:type II CAAX endopeptidase family protein [Gaiellaceae bacterium]
MIGALLVLLSLALLGAGGTALWADRTQRDGGYVTTDVHEFSTSGSALATVSTELGSAGIGWLYAPGLLGTVRIRVTPTSAGPPLFVGIGRSTDVDRYLAGVNHTVITEFWEEKTEAVAGSPPASAPGTQDFWVVSSTGSGPRTVEWDPTDGSWTVVVMNADGRPGIAVGADLGAKVPALLWIAGVLAAGALFLAGGALLIAGAFRRNRTLTTEWEGGVMSTPAITVPVPRAFAGPKEVVDRYEGIEQYSLGKIVAVWAAAALPMGILVWVVAPAIKDGFSGDGNVPLFKALLLLLTIGLIWQFVLVAGLVWREERTLRWTVVRDVLWLRSPRSPRTGRVGGRLWLIVIPLSLLFAVGGFVPTFSIPENRDFATWIGSDAGQTFMHGNWAWLGVILTLFLFNTVLGEELLFRGLLLPRMKGAFGRGDWVANAALFGLYHVHEPWLMPGTLLVDTLAYVYPSRRYQSAWIGIAVHSSQTLFFGALVFALVLR